MTTLSPALVSLTAGAVLVAPFAVAAPLYNDTVLADSPVAYYRLSETSGSTVADSAGGNAGSVQPGVNLNAAGPVGSGFGSSNSAALFNGSGTAAINLGTPVTAALAGAPAVTLESWIGADYGTAANTSYVAQFVGLNGTTGANLTIRNGALRVGGRSTGADGFRAGANISLAPFQTDFIHVVGVLDYTNDQILTYLNGQLVDTSSASFASDTFTPGGASSAIGAVVTSTGFATNFAGTIDESAFYGRALTATEVAEHYAARNAVVPEPASLALLSTGLVCLASRRRVAK